MQISSKYKSLHAIKIADIQDTFVLKLLNGKNRDTLNDNGLELIHDLIDSISLMIETLEDNFYCVTASLDAQLFEDWKQDFKQHFKRGK